MIFHSCEKVPEYKQDEGYFKGSMNGVKIETGKAANLYSPIMSFLNFRNCDLFGNGVIALVLKTQGNDFQDNLVTEFYTDALRNLDGKKYKKLNQVDYFTEKDCNKIPAIIQTTSRAYGLYRLMLDKNNYFQINNVEDDYITGCFEANFISKHFLETGIASSDKQNFPDSIFIVCDKFVAPIRN